MLRFWNGPLMDDEAGSAGGGDVAGLQARIEALGNAIKAEREAAARKSEAAAEKERQGLIRHELTRRGIAGEVADDAFRYFRDELTLTEDGKLVSKDGFTPAEDVFRRTLAVKRHWLPVGKGGTAPALPKAFDIDEIKPGITPEKKAEALGAINAVLKRMGSR